LDWYGEERQGKVLDVQTEVIPPPGHSMNKINDFTKMNVTWAPHLWM
jgi:hypothetical protein